MLSKFKTNLKSYKLCTPRDRILVAVSGGMDSMSLLHMFIASGYDIGVAHCNFQIRGESSNKDQALVKDICTLHHIPFYEKSFNVYSHALKHRMSTQMAARHLRYDWFAVLLSAKKYHCLATAHHLNDSIETTLLHFTRGTGLQGLRGIPRKMGSIIRPLLSFTRHEIKQYAQQHGIIWREDISNTHERYRRNKLRSNVIPLLKQINPSIENTYANMQKRLDAVHTLYHRGLSILKTSIRHAEGKIIIPFSIFQEIETPAPILWELVKKYGFNYKQCAQIIRCIYKTSGKKILSHTHILIVNRNEFIIAQKISPSKIVDIAWGSNKATLGNYRMHISYPKSVPILSNNMMATFDADRLRFPIQWRYWHQGDFFYPISSYRKKLSDYFIDKKLSLIDKQRITVVESANNIIWLPGYCIDGRQQRHMNGKTHRIIHLSISSSFS